MSSSYWRQQKERLVLQLKQIVEGEDYTEKIDKIDSITARNMRIKNFYGANNDELKYDKDYHRNCVILSPHINQPVKTLTTMEYFTLLREVNEKNKKK